MGNRFCSFNRHRARYAAPNVDQFGDGFEMCRVDAVSGSAQMVEFPSTWDCAVGQQERESVRKLAAVEAEPAIPVG